MIVAFPDLDTLRLTLMNGTIPAEVATKETTVSIGLNGTLLVEGELSRSTSAALKLFDVKSVRTHGDNPQKYLSWFQILPVVKSKAIPELNANSPILFEMSPETFPLLVTEIIRLGNDRQSYFSIKGRNENDPQRVFLKVYGPPYYTLLRAVDRNADSPSITAYTEVTPRIWIQYGFEHPLAKQLQPAEGQMLLLRPEKDWEFLKDGPLTDVYETLRFQLPNEKIDWQDTPPAEKIRVPLRLVAGNATDTPELWVLGKNGVDQLDGFVRDTDEKFLSQLMFAIIDSGPNSSQVVLRTRKGKISSRLQIEFEGAMEFRPFWKIENLYLPVASRLMPTLRRDTVRQLLAEDVDKIVWLLPKGDFRKGQGEFIPQAILESSFRPLEDWVDYVIDRDHKVLSAWVQATQFQFDTFDCRELRSSGSGPKSPPPDQRSPKKRPGEEENGETTKKTKSRVKIDTPNENPFVAPIPTNSAELLAQRQKLENEFLALEGGLDHPTRLSYWPQLALVNAALKERSEATICWLNYLWSSQTDLREAAWNWLKNEDPNASEIPTLAEFDSLLNYPNRSFEATRALAARILYASLLNPVPKALKQRLPELRAAIEASEESLPIRAVWLTWTALAHVGGSEDVLGLARVRDRIMQRILEKGLNHEKELIGFLRFDGERNSERLRQIRHQVQRIHNLAREWNLNHVDEKKDDARVNLPYVDLMFAFAQAKLGEANLARELIHKASESMPRLGNKVDPAHDWLLKAFTYRIEKAIEGKPHDGPFPQDLLSKLETLDSTRNNNASWKYIIDRFRSISEVLDPHEKYDPYSDWKRSGNELQKALVEIGKIKTPLTRETAIKSIYDQQKSLENRMLVLAECIPLSTLCGRDFALNLLEKVPTLLKELNTKLTDVQALQHSEKQITLFEKALFYSGHYDARELTAAIFEQFLEYINLRSGQQRADAISKVARKCLRSLRRLDLKSEIDRFLSQVTHLILQGQSLEMLSLKEGSDWPATIVSLLNLAEGWMYFGEMQKATPYLNLARGVILQNAKKKIQQPAQAIPAQKICDIAAAYASALVNTPVDEALGRIEELFKILEKVPNRYTTNSHFSRFHLQVIEAVVTSLVGENMTLGEGGKRWLDEDEYLVRRRIHSEMRELLASHGL